MMSLGTSTLAIPRVLGLEGLKQVMKWLGLQIDFPDQTGRFPTSLSRCLFAMIHFGVLYKS